MDLSLFRTLNGLTGHGWDWLFIFCASFLQYILGALVLFTTLRRTHIRLAEAAFGSALIARLAVTPLLQLFIHRVRPFLAIPDVHALVGVYPWENNLSMPSGHAIFFFALAAAVYRYDRRFGYWLFVGSAVIAVSRIITGVHWPSDVLVGALMGSVIGWLTVQLIPAFRRALPQS